MLDTCDPDSHDAGRPYRTKGQEAVGYTMRGMIRRMYCDVCTLGAQNKTRSQPCNATDYSACMIFYIYAVDI